MKIVHICLCGVFTDRWSYQENLLAKYHVKTGHRVTVVTSQWTQLNGTDTGITPKTNYVNDDGVNVIRLPIKHNKSIKYRFKRYRNFIETVKGENPDVLFIHGCQFLDILKLPDFLKRNKLKVYVDNHADFSNSASNFLSKYVLHGIIWRHCAKSIAPYTEKFYGVLPARVDFLVNVYQLPPKKVHLLVMGADDELVSRVSVSGAETKIREQYHVKADDFLLVTGGKIDLAKKQTLLLMEAVRKIKNENLKLIIFGAVVPELEECVLNMCDGNKICFAGWADNIKAYEFFSAADLAVFPGRHSVYWEQAAGQGIPLLVKHWPGVHHMDLGGNVDFINEDSVDELVQKIEAILNNPDKYKKMKQIATEKGMSEFSYNEIARRSING